MKIGTKFLKKWDQNPKCLRAWGAIHAPEQMRHGLMLEAIERAEKKAEMTMVKAEAKAEALQRRYDDKLQHAEDKAAEA